MKPGKKVENFVRQIHETLKNVPDAEVHQNFKVENVSKREREIDVLIIVKVSGLDLKIAIECKDYKRAIPVDKIESFHGKCLRLKGVSKKVFVSTSGYQADAIEAAKNFDIELFNLDEISKDEILNWLPIKMIDFEIRIKFPLNIVLDEDDEEIKNVPQKKYLELNFEDARPQMLSHIYIWNNVVVPNQYSLRGSILLEFVKNPERANKKNKVPIPFSLNLSNCFIIGKDGKKLKLIKISGNLVGWFNEKDANILDARSFGKKDASPTANLVSIDIGNNEKAEIVVTGDENISVFHTGEDGKEKQLGIIAMYDPTTNQLKVPKKKKG